MQHYVYLTTNSINGKKYIGSHSSQDINDSYLGSGLLIKKATKKYGKKNFSREILEICKNREKAVELEEHYIKKYDSLIPTGYNISPYGNAAFPGEKNPMFGKDPWNKGQKMNEEFRRKVSESLEGNQRHKNRKHSEETKRIISEKTKKRLSNKENHHFYGKNLSEEHVKKLVESHNGQIPWNKGKTGISEETREKMRLAKLGKKRSDETKRKISEGRTR